MSKVLGQGVEIVGYSVTQSGVSRIFSNLHFRASTLWRACMFLWCWDESINNIMRLQNAG